jgi:hypothetical protein
MIRTAMPFGYLFIALFLLAWFVLGICIFVWGWRRRSRPARWIGGAAVDIVTAIVLSEVAFDAALEWAPSITSDDLVIGTWTGGSETLTLASDNTFSYHTRSQTSTGTWTRDDWNLSLHGASYSGTMRFVEFRGMYRLMTHPPIDPDAWDGDLGLHLAKKH